MPFFRLPNACAIKKNKGAIKIFYKKSVESRNQFCYNQNLSIEIYGLALPDACLLEHEKDIQ